eukprot:gene8610-10199_t
MQLDVARLRDSRFASHTTGEGFRAGVLLWAASWHQVPAASVPDDLIELSQLAGFGRVTSEFQKVRAEALYSFVLCRDGRYYHPVVAEKALAAWSEKLGWAYGKLAERLRKENKKREAEGAPPTPVPSLDEWKSEHFPLTFQHEHRPETSEISASSPVVPPETRNFPPETFELSGAPPPEFQRKTLLKGEGEGEGEGYLNTPHTPHGGVAGQPAKSKGEPPEFAAFYAAYPRKVGRAAALKAWQKLSPDPALQTAILGALAAQLPRLDWREGGRFIPHPSTWLGQGRWADELAPIGAVALPSNATAERKPWEGAR